MRIVLAVIAITGLTILRCADLGAASPRRPNIIYILADDLGYGELGSYGQKRIETPVLDRLAREGMRFTQHYSGASVCAPARYSLMTGKHVGRSDTYGQGQKLAPDTMTIARMLRSAGYATGIFGKWGLGTKVGLNAPNAQGFDEWYGLCDQGNAHFHYPLEVWNNEKKVKIPENKGLRKKGNYGDAKEGVYIHDRFTEKAIDFIDRHKDGPFFVYLPYTIPHAEYTVPADSLAQYSGRWDDPPYVDRKGKNASGRKFYDGHAYCNVPEPRATYAAMVTRMDRDIGRIVDRVKAHGIEQNTLIVFASDNGPAVSGGGYDPDFFNSGGGLRGAKRSFYEGGLRTPMIAWWPENVPAGVVSDHVSYFPDILPTCAELAGVSPPEGIDGFSMAPTLLGKEGQKEHDYLFWIHNRDVAVRMGKWKYIYGSRELFDLTNDMKERRDVASSHAEVVKRIEDIISDNHDPKLLTKDPRRDDTN
jgi:arylsulfatase A